MRIWFVPILMILLIEVMSSLLYAQKVVKRDTTLTLPGGTKLEMIWVEPGSFTVGTTKEHEQLLKDEGVWKDWMDNEQPARIVTIKRGFFINRQSRLKSLLK